jgi:hypothetical protein
MLSLSLAALVTIYLSVQKSIHDQFIQSYQRSDKFL